MSTLGNSFPTPPSLSDRLIFDASERTPSYLIVGRNRSYIKLSPSAYHLLREVASGASFDQLAERLTQGEGRHVSATEVESAYQNVIQKVDAIEQSVDGNPWGFWFRRELLSESVVSSVARRLAVAFRSPVAALLIAVVVVAAVLATGSFLRFTSDLFEPRTFWPGYALFALSIFAHEFGHASACAHYGARPSGIGFTAYLIYPAFYSDVSAAWRLRRWQRVVVDAGGMFFQLAVAATYVFLYRLIGGEHFKLAVLMILTSCLFSLNPILKFDGYWMAADALGVTDLAGQPRRIVAHAWARLRGRAVSPLPWPRFIVGALSVYSILTFGFWAFLLWNLLPAFLRQATRYPTLIVDLATALVRPPHLPSGKLVQTLFIATYGLFFMGLFLFRVGAPSIRRLTSLLRQNFEKK